MCFTLKEITDVTQDFRRMRFKKEMDGTWIH